MCRGPGQHSGYTECRLHNKCGPSAGIGMHLWCISAMLGNTLDVRPPRVQSRRMGAAYHLHITCWTASSRQRAQHIIVGWVLALRLQACQSSISTISCITWPITCCVVMSPLVRSQSSVLCASGSLAPSSRDLQIVWNIAIVSLLSLSSCVGPSFHSIFLRMNWTASLANLVAISGGFHGIHSDFCVAVRMLIGFNFTVCPPSTSTMYRSPAGCPVRTRPLRPLSPSIRKPHRMISLPGHPSS